MSHTAGDTAYTKPSFAILDFFFPLILELYLVIPLLGYTVMVTSIKDAVLPLLSSLGLVLSLLVSLFFIPAVRPQI